MNVLFFLSFLFLAVLFASQGYGPSIYDGPPASLRNTRAIYTVLTRYGWCALPVQYLSEVFHLHDVGTSKALRERIHRIGMRDAPRRRDRDDVRVQFVFYIQHTFSPAHLYALVVPVGRRTTQFNAREDAGGEMKEAVCGVNDAVGAERGVKGTPSGVDGRWRFLK
jgi:hypothetical protein